MRVTINAKGYEGLKGEVAELTAQGARVTVNRKGLDLAPRTIFFALDAVPGARRAKAPAPVEVPAPVVEEPPAPVEVVGDLEAVEALARELMELHGLTAERWLFRWDRAKRRAGLCNYTYREISLSKPLMSVWTLAQARNTIVHEVAHALTPGSGHGAEWKAKCRELGIEPSRCWGKDGEARAASKYTATCAHCGHTFHRDRKSKYMAGATACSKCSPGKFDARFILTWVEG